MGHSCSRVKSIPIEPIDIRKTNFGVISISYYRGTQYSYKYNKKNFKATVYIDNDKKNSNFVDIKRDSFSENESFIKITFLEAYYEMCTMYLRDMNSRIPFKKVYRKIRNKSSFVEGYKKTWGKNKITKINYENTYGPLSSTYKKIHKFFSYVIFEALCDVKNPNNNTITTKLAGYGNEVIFEEFTAKFSFF